VRHISKDFIDIPIGRGRRFHCSRLTACPPVLAGRTSRKRRRGGVNNQARRI
jgi:hypothetical protein